MASDARQSDQAPDPDEAGRLRQLARGLRARQETVTAAASRIGARVLAGESAGDGDLAELTAWQAAVDQAARVLAADRETFCVTDLDEAADALERQAAERRDGELAIELARIAEVTDAGRFPQLGDVAARARAGDPATMAAELKDVFRALYRLMMAAAPADVNAADAEQVLGEFGMPVMLAAVGALHAAGPAVPRTEKQAAAGPRTVPEPAVGPEPVREPVLPDAVPEPDMAPGLDAVPEPERRIAAALTAGQTGLAYWYAVAHGLPPAVQAVFEVFALSEAVTMDGDGASVRIRQLLKDFDVTPVADAGPEYLRVLAAGAARSLLRMPFSPCDAVLDDSLAWLGDGPGHEFLRAVKHARDVGFELGRLDDVRRRSVAEHVQQREEALSGLRSTLEMARSASTRFPRATLVLKKIVGDAGEIGACVARILTAPDDLAPAGHLLARLRDVRTVDRLIDETDRRLNPVAARRAPIISGAREQVRSHIDSLLEALRHYVAATEALAARHRAATSEQLPGAVDALRTSVADAGAGQAAAPVTVGALAMDLARRWIRGVLAGQGARTAPVASPLVHDLVRGFELEWLADGTVEPASITPRALDAIAGRPAGQAYQGFADRDDRLGADRLIEALRTDGETELAARLAARQPDDQRSSRERLRRLADRAASELAHALYSALLSDSQSTELQGELERYRNPDVQDFPVARRHLDAIVAAVGRARDERVLQARQQLAELDCRSGDRARISRLLDEGDLVTALEFVAHLSSGETALPAEAAMDSVFTQFWPEFVHGAVQAAGRGDGTDPGWLEQLAGQRNGAPANISGVWLLPRESDRVIKAGLDGWLWLARRKRAHGWQDPLRDVLTLLGFEVKGGFPGNLLRSERWAGEIQAAMIGNALVPGYGSESGGRYQLLLCWGKRSPDRLLELVEELPPQPPVIVAYFNTISPRDRQILAERSRPHQKNVSAVIIDNAVIAFLTSRAEPRLQATMGLTLPFTAVNPYTPFVLGDVPREVFYGRREELRQVQDANGPLYVYGGRQLGKSALLKTATREFAEANANWRSIYLDLKGQGIGTNREPDDLWTILIPYLRAGGVIDGKVSAKAPPDAVAEAVRRWLRDDSGRRLLLLLDEADAFLETDARPRDGRGADSRFANVYLLKNLMDDSGRRFKPVFAGLHKVQRFHSVSNGPMGHVGAEILIGPLPPAEAFKLVVEPLAAIGYSIARPEVAWRLLAYTNYQASLIQLFCDELVRQMHRRALTHGSPPTEITAGDIEKVYGERKVRDWIASRFELTLDLDKRYRVIAYTTAWLTNASDRQVFDSITLYDECKTFWPIGFAGLSLDDFGAYLEEMAGLGVLVRTQSDEYGIRSPNVIRLLGSPAEIERKLLESDGLEVDPLFDPAVFRRALGPDQDTRSPLTEQQAQQILEGSQSPDGRAQLHAVLGSRALGLDRVAAALRVSAPEEFGVTTVTCESIHRKLAELARVRAGWEHVVLDLTGAVEAEQRTAVRRLHQFVSSGDRRSGSCLAPPGAGWIWESDLPDVRVRRVRIRIWTQDTLRAWAPDCVYPLSSAQQRHLLLADTGGWPQLVEAAVRAARHGSPQDARSAAMNLVTSDQGRQEFLLSVGMPADEVTIQVARAAAIVSDEVTSDELASLVETELPAAERRAVLSAVFRLVDLGVLGHGVRGDSYLINPLIARLLLRA